MKFVYFRHFIVLIASSSSVEDQLEWVGLVESKIRHLILALERNDHITLAHINPEQYDPVQPEPYVFHKPVMTLNHLIRCLFSCYLQRYHQYHVVYWTSVQEDGKPQH